MSWIRKRYSPDENRKMALEILKQEGFTLKESFHMGMIYALREVIHELAGKMSEDDACEVIGDVLRRYMQIQEGG